MAGDPSFGKVDGEVGVDRQGWALLPRKFSTAAQPVRSKLMRDSKEETKHGIIGPRNWRRAEITRYLQI